MEDMGAEPEKHLVWRDFASLLGSAISSLRPLSAGSIATEIHDI